MKLSQISAHIKNLATLLEGREGGYQIPVPNLNLAQIPVPRLIFAKIPVTKFSVCITALFALTYLMRGKKNAVVNEPKP